MKTRSQLYSELLDASKAQRSANVQTHKQRTARIKRSHARRQALKQKLSTLPLDILTIGDSLFEYPLYNAGPILDDTGIVSQVQLGSMGSPSPVILNQALHGQATTTMLSWENQDTLSTLLQDPSQWLNNATGLPDAILVSAGGDDIVGDHQFVIYLVYGGGGLDAARFQGVLDSVQASYRDLFAFRDIFAKGVPIIGHCYDFDSQWGCPDVCRDGVVAAVAGVCRL